MTNEEFLRIKRRIDAGQSVRQACGSDRTRKAYQRYKAKLERGEVAQIVEGVRASVRMTGNKDADVETLRKIGFEAAARIVEKPAYIPVWREVMRAYCQEFQEHKQTFTPQDYADLISSLLEPADESDTDEAETQRGQLDEETQT